MNVDLVDRLVLVGGPSGALRDALEAALQANGATILGAEGDLSSVEPFALVSISKGAAGLPADDDAGGEIDAVSRRIAGLRLRLNRIVTVMSGAALVPIRGLPLFSAEQAGLERMTRAFAMELGADCRVNGVALGAVGDERNGRERLVGHSAVRRSGTLEEACAVILFLLDPDNSYMTGHTLAVDGGWAIGYARNF